MPRGCRSIIVGILGFLILATSAPKHQPAAPQKKPGQQIYKAIARPAVPAGEAKKAPDYSPPCHTPQDHNRCELEAEWVSAQAARDAVKWSEAQTILGALGFFGLIGTLIYTARGTNAAVDAVEAQILTERPLMAINDLVIANPIIDRDMLKLTWEWSLKNYGRTGAWMEQVCVTFDDSFNGSDNEPAIINAFVAQDTYIGSSGGWIIFDKEETIHVLRDKIMLAWGYAIYRNAGGVRWKTGFAWRVSIDDQLNRTTIGPVPSDKHWFDVRLPSQQSKRWYQWQKKT